ncbi:MAG TPA: FG-GAP-like repeat-containing protein, partial [Opitutus sp.]|nr:FG-GAP-like repeat-containing protein [Opitutus sp.]
MAANQAANTVSVLFGQGTGVLSGRIDLAVKNAPYSPVIGDFDGDGHLDIAVANASSNSVSVLRGNGAGAFATQLQSSAGAGVRALATADFNGDGYLDLATANYNGATASILIGKGNGAFNAPVLLNVGPNPTAVAAGDLNRDDRPDLAVTCAGSNDVRVFLANGGGTFASASAYPTGSAPSAVAIADLDNDGWPDLAVTNENSNSVSILNGTGSGAFAASPNAIAVSPRPLGITTGHLDSDHVLDLVVASATNNMLTVLGGNGDGTFRSPAVIPAGVFSRAVALADFNADSRLDVAVGNMNGNDVWIVLNQTGTIADLAVSVSNYASSLRSGAPVSYEAVVSNLSSADVSELNLQLTVPSALVSPAFTPSAGAYDPATGAWTGLSLGGGQQAVLTIAGTVSEDAAGTIKLEAIVGPGAGYTDPVAGNNTAEDLDVLIRGDADLQVAISNGRTSVAAGDDVSYTITVSNVGPIAVQGAHVTTLLPGALRNVAWSCTASAGAVCPPAGSGAIDELLSLPVGGSATFVLAAFIDERVASGTLAVSASVAAPSDVIDPVAENDAATDEDALSGDAPPVAASQSLTLSEDGSVQVEVAATDADGDALTFSVVTPPAHGVLSGTAPYFTYTPAANYSGADTFVFQADD